MGRALSEREAAVLSALLAVEFEDAPRYRAEAKSATVVGGCDCGCPSIDFYRQPGAGMQILVNAGVGGTNDGMFLFAVGGHLGGIEWVGVDDVDPDELPDPNLLVISLATQPPR